jgi:ActR/RegA family two-component response regulator
MNKLSGTQSSPPFRLLLVDDEEPILYAMEQYFRAIGCEVDCARGTEEAEAFLEGSGYSGAIVDLRLTATQESEGLGVVSAVRRRNPLAKIVLLTAYGSPEVEREARRRGAHSLLHKPASLLDIANVMLGAPESRRGAALDSGQPGPDQIS